MQMERTQKHESRRRNGGGRGLQPGATHAHCSATDPYAQPRAQPQLQPQNQLRPVQTPAATEGWSIPRLFLPTTSHLLARTVARWARSTAIKAIPSRTDKKHSWMTATAAQGRLHGPRKSANTRPPGLKLIKSQRQSRWVSSSPRKFCTGPDFAKSRAHGQPPQSQHPRTCPSLQDGLSTRRQHQAEGPEPPTAPAR